MCHMWLSAAIFVQEDADDVESRPDCLKQQTDPIQESSLLQFLKSKSSFLLLLSAWWGWDKKLFSVFFISLNRFYLSLIYPPSPPLRFSSRCAANDADPRLPAGNPGPGEPGSTAGRPRHLHGQVHWETVQPDGLIVHHADRWEVFRGFRLQSGAEADWMSLPLQEESVSQWQYWAPSWEEWWCEGWNFLSAAPASCVQVPSWSACSPRCHCCSLAAPPRRSMGSFLLGNRHQHTNESHQPQSSASTPNRSPMFFNSIFPAVILFSALVLRRVVPDVTVLKGHLTQSVAPTAWSSGLPATPDAAA